MNPAESPSPAVATPAVALPDLHNAHLDVHTVTQLLRDIQLCTEVTEIIPKFAGQSYVDETGISLAEARELLLAQRLRALQIRYRYQGAVWWDTLLCAQGQFRLVRIRHEFP